MSRKAIGALLLAISLMVSGCGSAADGSSAPSSSKQEVSSSAAVSSATPNASDKSADTERKAEQAKMDATQILYTISQSRVAHVENVIVCDEDTDPNGLLGRPNQYTSKVNFDDDRIERVDLSDFTEEDTSYTGGTIEVFENTENAATRRKYIESVFEEMPILAEYIFQRDHILMRVNYDLTPTQAKEYEDALTGVDLGKDIEVPDSFKAKTPNEENKENPTDLFETVYVGFAERRLPSDFSAVKSVLESSEYQCEIVEPTKDKLAHIQVFDNQGTDDSVYIGFMEKDGIEVIMTVSYHQKAKNREVAMNNLAPENDARYDKLSTHIIGESETAVSGVEDQRTFLFS